jgi:Ni,Fe-hydrogenase maturation factor
MVSTITVDPAEGLPRIFTHHLDPASLLRLASELYGRSPSRATVIAVGGEEFDLKDELSASVLSAIPAVVETFKRELASWHLRVRTV